MGPGMKELIRKKIQQREYTLPLGIFVPVKYQVAFLNREEDDFGNREDLLCPYFDHKNKNCGIWEHRGSVCTSYFCVSDRGERGLQFWETLGEYLHRCEMILAQDCVVTMGLSHECIDGQLEYINCETGTAEELASNSMSPAIFQSYWSDWDGDIETYYGRCCDYAKQLNLKELEQILSEETSDLEEVLKQRY
jgi:Fe-S-cluster containining protein